MNDNDRNQLINTVIKREKLRPMARLSRLLKDPVRALPYYVLAAVSHVRPFKLTFKTLWQTDMTCYLPEGNTFYYYGFCEANVTNFLLLYVKEGMTVIDVGAHVGIYSMLGSELVGETGQVHSFEPTPWTFDILKTNTEKLPNVTGNNLAVATTARTLTFADYGPGYGAYNSAHKDAAGTLNKPATSREVASVSLDNYCLSHDLKPDILKIDAEGFEYEVLMGSTTILEQSNPNPRPLVLMEVANGDTWKENRTQSFTFLEEADYVPFEMHDSGMISTHAIKESYQYDNLLFVPRERINELTKLTI